MSTAHVRISEVQPADLTLEAVRERMQRHGARVQELIRRYPVPRATLLQALWLVQEEFGWVPRQGIRWAAEVAQVAPVHAFAVVEFYTMYKQVPPARWHIRICHNVACHIQGAEELIAHCEQALGIQAGEHTADGLFALERVECLAACGNGPAVQINDEFLYGPGGINAHQDGWHPDAAALDATIACLRSEAAQGPALNPDELGGIVLGTAGHPGAIGAQGQALPDDYAPPPPALRPAAKAEPGKVTVTAAVAPDAAVAVIERSDDQGSTWRTVGEVDVTQVKGPPGAKNISWSEPLAAGVSASWRVVVRTGTRTARPSATVQATGMAEVQA